MGGSSSLSLRRLAIGRWIRGEDKNLLKSAQKMAKPSQPQQPGVESAIPPVIILNGSDPERIAALGPLAANSREPDFMGDLCCDPVGIGSWGRITGGGARRLAYPRLLWLGWLCHPI